MIDFVKLQYAHHDINVFVERHRSLILGVLHLETGDLTYPYTFHFEEYKITIREGLGRDIHYIEIAGSIHKNYFSGKNYRRFTFEMLQSEIQWLSSSLNLEPEGLRIQNLEVGVNIVTPFPPFAYLSENLLLYKTKPFSKYSKGKDGKELGFFCDGTPIVKLYDKGKQYTRSNNLLRFELRYLKARELNDLDVCTLQDLTDISKIAALTDKLLRSWENVLLYESTMNLSNPNITNKQRKEYKDCEHPKNWQKVLKDKASKTSFYKRKNAFKQIIRLYGENVHRTVAGLLKDEVQKCMNSPVSNNTEVCNFTHIVNCEFLHLASSSPSLSSASPLPCFPPLFLKTVPFPCSDIPP